MIPQTLRPIPPFIFADGDRLSDASLRGLRPVSLDLDPVLVLAYLHEIVGSLASQPELAFRPAPGTVRFPVDGDSVASSACRLLQR